STKWAQFDAIGIGPGLGQRTTLFAAGAADTDTPRVIDADALTFLSQHDSWLHKLPKQSILTPHMKEFDRLFGRHENWWDRVTTAQEQAVAHQLMIVLKNQYTFIAMPDGDVLINPTGNPAMASG